MSAFRVDDHIRFTTMTPDGRLVGQGRISKIFPAGNSFWLHVDIGEGQTRMLYEATAKVEHLELEPA